MQKRAESEKPVHKTLHWFIRNTGCDMLIMDDSPDPEEYKTYKERSQVIFELFFCFNEDYFPNEYFCVVKLL